MIARIASRLLELVRSTWLFAGATLVCLLLVEALAGLSLWLKAPNSPTFSSHEDAPQLWSPDREPIFAWHPYVYWRSRPSSGTHVNADERGLRRTFNPPVDASEVLQVFVFGGSTVWGSGARDEFTVPSLLSKIIAEKTEVPAEVTNFGQAAYVTTQELIALIIELQKGNLPDIVVFYGGVNDVLSSFQAGEAGVPQAEVWRRLDFEFPERAFLFRLARHSRTVQLVRSFGNPSFAETWSPPEEGADLSALARETVRVYTENVRLGQALADQLGFQVLYYWQPALWSKQPLTAYELATVGRMARRNPGLGDFYRAVYERAEAAPELNGNPRFRNLSHLFDDSEDTAFWDWCHVTEEGNRRIAEQIAQEVLEILDGRRAGS